MKKMILMFSLLSLPAFATDIPYTNDSYTSSTCDSGVLQHDSGTVRLRAKYEPNTMNIRWYNNNTELNPTNAAANTCEYDSTLTLPTNTLTRTGYTFAGWRVRPLTTFSNSALGLTSAVYLERWGKGNYVNTPYCRHSLAGENADSVNCNSDSHFTKMNVYEWQVRYDNNGKTLYGMAHCSKKPGNIHNTWPVADRDDWQTSTINELDTYISDEEARYCWCKATGYRASSPSPVQGSTLPLGWVFDRVLDDARLCARNCAIYCTTAASKKNYRDALFLPVESED